MKVLNSIMAVLMAYLSQALAGPVPILSRRNLLPKHFNWAPPGPKDGKGVPAVIERLEC